MTDLEAPKPLHPPPHCPTCACEEDYDPFTPPGPPMPEAPPLPTELYVEEESWEHWQGSPIDIARIARRADDWIDKHFTNFSQLPKAHWYLPGGQVMQQNAVHHHHTVRTSRWVGGATADHLADEIQARRDLVLGVRIESDVIYRAWFRDDVFKTVPLRDTPAPEQHPPGSVSISTESVSPPHKIEVFFDTETPAARLRVIAPSQLLCRNLFDHMRPHVAAGARTNLWPRRRVTLLGASVGVLGGVAVGVFVLPAAGVGSAVLLAFVLGSAGDLLVRWASPPLELVDAGEKRRWSLARTYAWQGTLFALALVSILLAVIFA